jgi:hypothetical protein
MTPFYISGKKGANIQMLRSEFAANVKERQPTSEKHARKKLELVLGQCFGSGLNQGCGSGFGIRIRIQKGKITHKYGNKSRKK